jgi:hypothetical protein
MALFLEGGSERFPELFMLLNDRGEDPATKELVVDEEFDEALCGNLIEGELDDVFREWCAQFSTVMGDEHGAENPKEFDNVDSF